MQRTHVFVTGTTRAGTTVFRLMLGSHPQIVELGELEWVFGVGLPPDGPADADALARWRDWLRDHRNARHTGIAIPDGASYADTVAAVLEQRRASRGPDAPVVVAVFHGAYEHLRRLYPDARYIHLSRDPRDVIASWLTFGWVGNAWAGARWWRELQDAWGETRARIPQDRCMELRFEDLVGDAEASLRHVADFVGVPYDDAMLRFHEGSTYDPVDAGQAYKWRRKMDPGAVRIIDAEAGPAMAAWGYEPAETRVPTLPEWQTRALWVDDRVRRQVFKIRRFGAALWAKELLARRMGLEGLQREARMEMDDIVQRSVK